MCPNILDMGSSTVGQFDVEEADFGNIEFREKFAFLKSSPVFFEFLHLNNN